MSQTRNNHYVPQWYQNGFAYERDNELRHLKIKQIEQADGSRKIIESKKWYSPAQCFYKKDLYSTFFGGEVSDSVEKQLFGPIDHNGAEAVKAFLTNDQYLWHHNFVDFFSYLDAQKLRTPKGLDWVKARYPELSQTQLMFEMQQLRNVHCTLWAEGVRELVSADESEVKFIISDHPITIYNHACPPDSALCLYPNDPDIALKGSQTIFPLNRDRCLILTNLEYAKAPDDVDPLEPRTNATKVRQSLVNTVNFINGRKLTTDEVMKINYIIKSRSKDSIAAGKECWLYPEAELDCDWRELRHILLPASFELGEFGGEMYARYNNGETHYQDAFGRSSPQNKSLEKEIDESALKDDDICGCGNGRKYQECCKYIPKELRASWTELSIRERNLSFCRAIKGILGLDAGKSWVDVRRDITDEQIVRVYSFYSFLWPRETDIYSLLPKSDGKFRALYTGIVDIRTIGFLALPMASLFDEYLIESPIVNPLNLRPEFSPIKSPSKYRYQALKDFLLMLELEPFIGYGLVNLIPDPSDFDLNLKRAMMDMATTRNRVIESERDLKLMHRIAMEDNLNLMHMSSSDIKIRFVSGEFGLSNFEAGQLVRLWEENAEASPLTPLQDISLIHSGGQYTQFAMVPNYEMSLFIAQATGSVIVTDSECRWAELKRAQHNHNDAVSYPWTGIYEKISRIPLDYRMVESCSKTEFHFALARSLLKSADAMVCANERATDELHNLNKAVELLDCQLEETCCDETVRYVNADCTILAPEGGIYDRNVQRLLIRSGCLHYDQNVRSIYYVSLELSN
ncbi:MAG: DUF4238 domain-containing protein [Cellvibrio sp.]|uniref:hypothetical protein n=1 Tax=Cellvibrio sp. TaxID=1965322 RepID=UPI0027279139|nr:DUF4238 domain-containing protein [Cellvibrio sp.]